MKRWLVLLGLLGAAGCAPGPVRIEATQLYGFWCWEGETGKRAFAFAPTYPDDLLNGLTNVYRFYENNSAGTLIAHSIGSYTTTDTPLPGAAVRFMPVTPSVAGGQVQVLDLTSDVLVFSALDLPYRKYLRAQTCAGVKAP